MKMTVKTRGGLSDGLRRLEKEIPAKGADKAVSAMAGIVRDEARRLVYTAPKAYLAGPSGRRVLVKPGHVGRNIVRVRIPAAQRRADLAAQFVVRVSGSRSKPEGAANIAVFLEYGINMSRPYPFMRPALDNKRSQAVAAAKSVLKKEIAWKK